MKNESIYCTVHCTRYEVPSKPVAYLQTWYSTRLHQIQKRYHQRFKKDTVSSTVQYEVPGTVSVVLYLVPPKSRRLT